MIKVLNQYQQKGIEVALLYVPAHVGVHGNEDRLTKDSVRRKWRNTSLTAKQIEERKLDNMSDDIVSHVITTM